MKTLWGIINHIAYIVGAVIMLYAGIQGDWQKMGAFALLLILMEAVEIKDRLKADKEHGGKA